MPSRRAVCAALVALCAGAWQVRTLAQPSPTAGVTVTAAVTLAGANTGFVDRSDVVVWLTPAGDSARPRPAQTRRYKIDQQQKRFQPHVLVVPVGSSVDFPNLDPIFHNVFSLFDGKRFDLGLYEAGTSRSVSFTRTGVCYVFCNIHPGMAAYVMVVDSPYFAVSDRHGGFLMPSVAPGSYTYHAWRAGGETLTGQTTVDSGTPLDVRWP